MADNQEMNCPMAQELARLKAELEREKQKNAALRVSVDDIVRTLRAVYIGTTVFVTDTRRMNLMDHIRAQIAGTFEWDEESFDDLANQCSYHTMDAIEWNSHFEGVAQEDIVEEYYDEPKVIETVKYIMSVYYQSHTGKHTVLDGALRKVSRC